MTDNNQTPERVTVRDNSNTTLTSRKETLDFFNRVMSGIEAEAELQAKCQCEYEVVYTFNVPTFQPHMPYLGTAVHRCKKCGREILSDW